MAHGGEPGPLLEFLDLGSIEDLQYLTLADLDEQFRAKNASPATKAGMRRLFHAHFKAPLVRDGPSSLLTTDAWSTSSSDPAPTVSATKFLDVVRCITLPNNTAYRGRTDDRSITAYLNSLYQEVVQADLTHRQAWLLLLRAFDEPAKTSLRQAVQASCVPRGVWMKDFLWFVKELPGQNVNMASPTLTTASMTSSTTSSNATANPSMLSRTASLCSSMRPIPLATLLPRLSSFAFIVVLCIPAFALSPPLPTAVAIRSTLLFANCPRIDSHMIYRQKDEDERIH
ncbi:hypothetical protein FOZ60_005360 [Perkinsus olseni]|uniref:Uncharacterized protein n=1 Tax=Perkinsus olseni TaxID=32597 RepID=A0A7J6NRY8_PEROL|nr:hypothetical protein FOZ60_005360 [Perkinsus olseni]